MRPKESVATQRRPSTQGPEQLVDGLPELGKRFQKVTEERGQLSLWNCCLLL